MYTELVMVRVCGFLRCVLDDAVLCVTSVISPRLTVETPDWGSCGLRGGPERGQNPLLNHQRFAKSLRAPAPVVSLDQISALSPQAQPHRLGLRVDYPIPELVFGLMGYRLIPHYS